MRGLLIILVSLPLVSALTGWQVFWDFSNGVQSPDGSYSWADHISGHVLKQHNSSSPVTRADDGVFGNYSAEFAVGQRLVTLREKVPELANISGPAQQVTVVAWVKLLHPLKGGAFVGGVWEEDTSCRQYALFMDGTGGCPTKDGIVAHISGEGGPSPGQKYCKSRACGGTSLPLGDWHCIANVYNGTAIVALLNGTLDTISTPANNPFKYPNPPSFPTGGIYTPPAGLGANLALGANFVHPGGGTGPKVMSNKFSGRIGGFAIANRAMAGEEVRSFCKEGWNRPDSD
jgi:hypothetical protein